MTKLPLIILACAAQAVTGFVVMSPTRPVSSRRAGVALMETEDDARYILSRAKIAAYNGDFDDIQDCEMLLNEMLHMQSGCVTGTLVGHDLCEEQAVAADVVAHLREKIKTHKQKVSERTHDVVPMVATELVVGAMVLVVAIFWTTLDMSQRHDMTPNSLHEWGINMRDGHFDSMIQHYFHSNGGSL